MRVKVFNTKMSSASFDDKKYTDCNFLELIPLVLESMGGTLTKCILCQDATKENLNIF